MSAFEQTPAGGPLAGLRVVELAAMGPAPFAAMVLADLGADVVRIDRPGAGALEPWTRSPVLDRSRRSVALDLKDPAGLATAGDLIAGADVLVEGFRPGVMERLGLGPDACLARNPGLVYVRMTGWGQSGPLAGAAGHDITYLATTGVLHAIGRAGEAPGVPLNLLGDFGGGGMFAVCGALAGVLHALRTGEGQVVDASIVDGVAVLSGMIHGFRAQGAWSDDRGQNLLDSGAPFYDVYACADGHMAVGALERRFLDELLAVVGLAGDEAFAGDHLDRSRWPLMRDRLAAALRPRTRAEWVAAADGRDCCLAPVLSFDEAAVWPHNVERRLFVDVDGVRQPAPAPRFSRSVPPAPRGARRPGDDSEAVLAELEAPAEGEGIEVEIDPMHFRDVLGRLPTGVTVITANLPDGPVGLACNSFTSVSLDPPLVSFCVAHSSTTWPKLRRAGRFCVNVLASHHAEASRRFGQRGVDRFGGGHDWIDRPCGPGLRDAAAWVDCTIEREVELGDHLLVVGRVCAMDPGEEAVPLVFFRSAYGRFHREPHPQPSA